MELMHIKEQVCPICGSEIVEESRKNKHSNGHWNEVRKFECGLMLTFSPNFMRTEKSSVHVCKNDQKVHDENIRNMMAKKKLIKYINRLDISSDTKENLIGKIEYFFEYSI